jgi:hypothetical protein
LAPLLFNILLLSALPPCCHLVLQLDDSAAVLREGSKLKDGGKAKMTWLEILWCCACYAGFLVALGVLMFCAVEIHFFWRHLQAGRNRTQH